MFRILLVRPGLTEYDQQGRIQGTLDIPLSEDGRLQVAAATDQLRGYPVAAVYSSPNQSAEQTARALAEAYNLKPKSLDKLHNLDHGLWQGMLVDDVRTKQPKVYRQWQEQPERVCPPQGEPVSAVRQRVQEVISRLAKRHKADPMIAIVASEPLASVIRNVIRHDDLGDFWEPGGSKAAWELIDVPETAEVG